MCVCVRLNSAKSEQQIEKILEEARADGMDQHSTVTQAATQRRHKLNASKNSS